MTKQELIRYCENEARICWKLAQRYDYDVELYAQYNAQADTWQAAANVAGRLND